MIKIYIMNKIFFFSIFFIFCLCAFAQQQENNEPVFIMEPERVISLLSGERDMPEGISSEDLFSEEIKQESNIFFRDCEAKISIQLNLEYAVQKVLDRSNKHVYTAEIQRKKDRSWVVRRMNNNVGLNMDVGYFGIYSPIDHSSNFPEIIIDLTEIIYPNSKEILFNSYQNTKIVYENVVMTCNKKELLVHMEITDMPCGGTNKACGWLITKFDVKNSENLENEPIVNGKNIAKNNIYIDYIDYVVKKGDSLHNIAKEFDSNHMSIMVKNKLESEIIYPNQVLSIPVYRMR